MKKNSIFLFYNMFLIFCNILLAQNKNIAIANKKFDSHAYIDAIKIYERMANKGYSDHKVLKKLGDCYYFNADYDKSYIWYKKLFDTFPEQNPEYLYRYAQSLKSIGNYNDAALYLTKFSSLSNEDLRAKQFDRNRNYLESIEANSGRYEIHNININSNLSDFGSTILNSKLVFTSSRVHEGKIKKKSIRDNNPYNSLFLAEIKNDSVFLETKLFSNKSIASDFNESTPAFTKNGKTMYFTRNSSPKDKKGNPIVNLKIFKSYFKNNSWTTPIELPFNSDKYNVAHPALSDDEKTLFFASDMPGTYGQSDLFYVKINNDETYSSPHNLGKVINTEGKETFPFVSQNNELYFSSDGHPGLGGLDIFVSKIDKNITFDKIENIGLPINGQQDDFAFYLNTNTNKGYFSSNRIGGLGLDDIYSFLETRKLNVFVLDQLAKDKNTGLPIANTKITLFDSDFNFISETETDSSGHYSLPIDFNKTFYIRAEHDDYLTFEKPIFINKYKSNDVDFSIQMEKRILEIQKGDDLAKLFDIGVLYFDWNKDVVTKKASVQLEKVLELLNQYPTIKIDIRTHTDSRGTFNYNLKLSNKRFNAVCKWFVKNRIDSKRISGKGYGESNIINICKDNVRCSEQLHEENRRVEFIFISN